MRNILILASLVMCVALSSCEQKPKLPGIGETVVLKDSICITVQLTERTSRVGGTSASGGQTFVNTQILMENYSGKDYFLFNKQFSLLDTDSNVYKPKLSTKVPALGPSATIANGTTKQGWVTFYLPEETTDLKLSFQTDLLDGETGLIELEEDL